MPFLLRHGDIIFCSHFEKWPSPRYAQLLKFLPSSVFLKPDTYILLKSTVKLSEVQNVYWLIGQVQDYKGWRLWSVIATSACKSSLTDTVSGGSVYIGFVPPETE